MNNKKRPKVADRFAVEFYPISQSQKKRLKACGYGGSYQDIRASDVAQWLLHNTTFEDVDKIWYDKKHVWDALFLDDVSKSCLGKYITRFDVKGFAEEVVRGVEALARLRGGSL